MLRRFWPFRSSAVAEIGVTPTRIVADGIVSSPSVANGRVIPALILDSADRADFVHLVDAHAVLPPGDVTSTWVMFPGISDFVGLRLDFVRPVECTLLIPFEIERQGILVDMILQSKAAYLQPGNPGDRLTTTPNAPKVLVEITAEGLMSKWKKLYHLAITKRLQQEGLSRSQAESAARVAIASAREIYLREKS